MGEDRFERVYKQSGFAASVQIWVDKETGVNYMYMSQGYSGGFTPLLGRDGKPVITPLEK